MTSNEILSTGETQEQSDPAEPDLTGDTQDQFEKLDLSDPSDTFPQKVLLEVLTPENAGDLQRAIDGYRLAQSLYPKGPASYSDPDRIQEIPVLSPKIQSVQVTPGGPTAQINLSDLPMGVTLKHLALAVDMTEQETEVAFCLCSVLSIDSGRQVMTWNKGNHHPDCPVPTVRWMALSIRDQEKRLMPLLSILPTPRERLKLRNKMERTPSPFDTFGQLTGPGDMSISDSSFPSYSDPTPSELTGKTPVRDLSGIPILRNALALIGVGQLDEGIDQLFGSPQSQVDSALWILNTLTQVMTAVGTHNQLNKILAREAEDAESQALLDAQDQPH